MGMLPFEVATALPIDEAKRRVEALLKYWSRKYGINSSWAGATAIMKGKAMGVTIDGALEVLAQGVKGHATDPGMLLRGQAQKYIRNKFAEYLDPSRPLNDIINSED